jgi:hypothetical protein
MCSLSFHPTSRGFLLAMNRDEQRERPLARPPGEYLVAGLRTIYPSEPDGGTWIGGNEHGVVLALLNWYAIPAPAGSGSPSRGTIIPALLGSPTAKETGIRLASLPLKTIKPFRLFTFSGHEHLIVESRWDGARLEEFGHPWIKRHSFSSGFDELRATSIRAATCEQHAARISTKEDLLDLHRSHHPEKGPFSLCMHRDDAQTVSCTLFEWSMARLSIDYLDGLPCLAASRHHATLETGVS